MIANQELKNGQYTQGAALLPTVVPNADSTKEAQQKCHSCNQLLPTQSQEIPCTNKRVSMGFGTLKDARHHRAMIKTFRQKWEAPQTDKPE